MKVPRHIVDARRDKLAALIDRHRYLPVSELCRQLGVSEATARRDLAVLVAMNKVKRTHGGALSEFNERFLSFKERQTASAASKAAIARSAVRFFEPGGVYFLDSGTTIFALAEVFCANPISPVTIVTSNIPVGELLSAVPEVSVFQLAGQILNRQSVLLGEMACRSLEFWKFDIAFLSAEAANSEGIWNTQEIIVRQQIAAIHRSARVLYCVDRDKIGAQAPFLLQAWEEVDCLLTDAPSDLLEAQQIPLVRTLGTRSRSLPPENTPVSPAFPVHFL
jgi:DeoR/GlpR family transcriptional regulator of sugar metabolism